MTISCVQCEREIPATDVNIETGIAKCTACNAVFGILDQVGGPTAANLLRGSAISRESVTMPKRFSVDDFGNELRIQYRWFTPKVFALLAFCIFWDGFLIVWYAIAFTMDTPLMMKVFPILHLAVGVGLTYYVIAIFLNRTTITVSDGEYRVEHGPVRWPGQRSGFSDDIDQLYVTQQMHTNKGSVSITYNVMVRLKDGERVKLVSGLDDANQALFLEQKIEEFLRIRDHVVPGELPR